MATPPRLRVALLTGRATELNVWQRRVTEHLIRGGDAEIVGVAVESANTRSRRRRDRLLWSLYNNRWVARRSGAIHRVHCADLLNHVPRIAVTPEVVGRFSQHFPAEAIGWLREREPDVLLRFGFGILRGEVLEAARYGIWSFHHDDERVIRGGPPSFWEVNDEMPTTGVLFQRLADKLDAGVPLARATFRTVGYSYPRNRDRAALGAAVLPAKVARAVRYGVLDPGDLLVAETSAPIRRDPTNAQMLRFLVAQGRRAVAARIRGVLVGAKWGIGVAVADNPATSRDDVADVEWLPERSAGYYADPFPATRDGVTAVLVEDFDERTARGVISAFRRDGDRWSPIPSVIDPGVHASYPFLVEADGDLHCVPETAELGRVEAWRCRQFPDRWKRVGTLVEEPVIDPTVVEWQGRWWMFGGHGDHDANTELWLWSADSFLGPWTPHPQNPVKIDVTSSRPAGTPFVRDGVLYRPAQDCSGSYGGAIMINEVTRIDADWYEERTVGRIDAAPGRYPAGRHTISFGGGLVAVDGKRRVVDLHRSRRELVARLRRRK